MPNIKKGPAGRASKRNPEKSGTKKRLGGGLVDKIGQKLHIKKATPERSTWENLCFIDKGSAESHPPGSPLNFQKEPKSSTKKSTKPPPVPAGGGLSVCLLAQADGVIVSCARMGPGPSVYQMERVVLELGIVLVGGLIPAIIKPQFKAKTKPAFLCGLYMSDKRSNQPVVLLPG